jgi:hypothetical protein
MSKNVEIYEKLAKKYDLATTIVSFGIEKIWRKIFVKKIKKYINNALIIHLFEIKLKTKTITEVKTTPNAIRKGIL